MRKLCAFIFIVAFATTASPVIASVTGVVRGNVLVDNAPKAGVQLTLKGEGAALKASTDAAGNYIFNQVPFGDYTLSAHYAGVADRTIQLNVASDQVAVINLTLGALKIIANASVTARGGVGGTPVSSNTIGRQQIAALPSNDSLNRIVQTVPGIVRFSYNEPVAHGFHGIAYEIDGAPIPQATSSNFSEIVDPKNVDSVEVFTGAIPAEFGGTREGAVVNIISNRASDLQRPSQGTFSFAGGNFGQGQIGFSDALKAGQSEVFFSANSQHTDRGLDTPTYDAIHDRSSQSDQFLRFITPVTSRGSLAFDFSNQLAQFQIPINTDPANPIDPQVAPPRTDDVQREYDRYANLNFTMSSKDGNGVFSLIPWVKVSRIAYDGDLPNDVLTQFGTPDPVTGPNYIVGLRQDRLANYAGVRISQLRSTGNHTIKVGADLTREFFHATQTFAQNGQPNVDTATQQTGSQVGAYVEDKWQPSRKLSVSSGLRYDRSTGYTSGYQLSPRVGVNIAPDAKNIVHFYYGRFYAAPQLEDVRQACVVLQGCPTVPVYDLKPERDAYFEMGVAHTFSPSIDGYVNFFERNAVNVLDTTQLLNTPLFAVFNNAIGRDEGVELRIQGRRPNADSWFVSATASHAEAAGVSGSTFLFPPSANPPGPVTAGQLQPEDHDQAVEANGAYTHRWGPAKSWFATLQGEYGTGYPVAFQAGVDRLPAHLTFDLGLGKEPGSDGSHALGFNLDVNNLLNHQYVIKIANGFNTTQIASGRNVLLRLSTPF